MNYYKIKQWCPESQNKWIPTYYYIVKPILPRTIGYIVQSNIDKLITNKIYYIKFLDVNFNN